MSAPGFTPIQLYYSTTASAAPSSGNLANGELAINITDGKLYYKDNGGTVRVLAGTGGTGVVAGSNTQVQFNNNGVFGASSGLTFDGTTLTANALTVSNATTLSGGTANGVAYLNGSKVLTTGSALTFDGSSLGVAGRASLTSGSLSGAGNGMHLYFDTASNTGYIKGFHAGVADRAIRLDGLNLQFAVAGTERARIDSSGNLLVGTTSTGAGLGTNSAIVGSYGPVFKSTGGSGYEAGDFWNASTTGDAYFVYWRTEAGGTVRGSVNYNRSLGLTSYNTTSDRRAKDILGPVTNSGETIDAIQVHIGKMHGATQSRPMFIADELQGPAPYCVTGEKNAVNEKGEPVYQQVDHSPLIPLLVAEIQSLRKRLAAAGIA